MVVTYGGCEAFAVDVKYYGVAVVNIFYLVVIVIVLVVGGFAASAFFCWDCCFFLVQLTFVVDDAGADMWC